MAAETKCYTSSDVKMNVCWALCRQDGFDTGSYEQKSDSCICGQRKEYKEYTKTVLKILSGAPAPSDSEHAPHFYYRPSD